MRDETVVRDFAAFWAAYPRRIGKLAALKAYCKVRRGGIPHEELMDGITQYIATKPAYADWCHPTTWLNQGRWMDEVAPRSIACGHTPPCPNRWSHGQLLQAEDTGDLELIVGVKRLIAKRAQQ
jgi:hypothetical protein